MELAELSILFSSALVIALRTPRQAQEAATQGTPISPSVFIALDVRWEIPEAALRLHRVNVVLPLQGCVSLYALSYYRANDL